MTKIFSQSKKNKGFTILELLVVIAIIGILSAIIMASLNTSRSKARDAKRVEEIRQLVNALELYYNTTASYPSKAQLQNPNKAQNPLSPYLWPIPRDPKTNAFYNYTGIRQSPTPQLSACVGYHIGASFENNNQLLQNDSDFNSNATNRCVLNAAGTAASASANTGFSGLDNQAGNNKYKYDLRR